MDIDAAFQEAIQKANDGDIQSAQIILASIVRQEPRNARAWYLLSQVIGDRNREIDCLKKVLEIEPNSQQAKARLEKLQQVSAPVQPKPAISPVQPIPKKKKTNALWIFLILGLGIVALCLVVFVYIQNFRGSGGVGVLNNSVLNLPDATQCVSVGPNPTESPLYLLGECIGINSGGNTLLTGDITNTCSKPITKIGLHGRVVGDVGYQTNVTLGEVSNILQVVLQPNAATHVSLTIPNSNFGLAPIPCIIDVQSAYFVK